MLDSNNSTGDNANIVKTKGDGNTTTIINNNLDIGLITTVVKGILYDSLPAFQLEASEKVQASIQSYISELVTELVSQGTTDEKINTKLPLPDIQYSIYETAKSYAKAPNRISKYTLINLVVQKINANEEDLDGLTILDMAIEASTKMNGKQIKYIAFIYYINNIVKVYSKLPFYHNITIDPANSSDCKIAGNVYLFHNQISMPKEYVNDLYIKLYTDDLVKVFPDGDLLKAGMSIPTALGCVTQLQFQRIEIADAIKKRTDLDITDHNHAIKLSPLRDRLLTLGGVNEVSQLALTEIGQKIGEAYVSTRMRLVNSQ